jgi:hypothetical protein
VGKPGISIKIPGQRELLLRHVISDYTGTLSYKGKLVAGVAERLRKLGKLLDISQVKKFGQSALSVGLSRQEVIEAVIQTAPYGGFPRALNALAALSDVFSEEA